jgi:hypothetical protein
MVTTTVQFITYLSGSKKYYWVQSNRAGVALLAAGVSVLPPSLIEALGAVGLRDRDASLSVRTCAASQCLIGVRCRYPSSMTHVEVTYRIPADEKRGFEPPQPTSSSAILMLKRTRDAISKFQKHQIVVPHVKLVDEIF